MAGKRYSYFHNNNTQSSSTIASVADWDMSIISLSLYSGISVYQQVQLLELIYRQQLVNRTPQQHHAPEEHKRGTTSQLGVDSVLVLTSHQVRSSASLSPLSTWCSLHDGAGGLVLGSLLHLCQACFRALPTLLRVLCHLLHHVTLLVYQVSHVPAKSHRVTVIQTQSHRYIYIYQNTHSADITMMSASGIDTKAFARGRINNRAVWRRAAWHREIDRVTHTHMSTHLNISLTNTKSSLIFWMSCSLSSIRASSTSWGWSRSSSRRWAATW